MIKTKKKVNIQKEVEKIVKKQNKEKMSLIKVSKAYNVIMQLGTNDLVKVY